MYGDAARAAQLAREMQQTAVPAAGESAAGTDGAEMPAHASIIDKIKAGEEQSFEQMGMTCDTNMDFSNSTLGEVSVYEPTLF